MASFADTTQRWAAMSLIANAVDPLAAVRGMGLLTAYWERPGADEAYAGVGLVAEAAAERPDEVGVLLARLSSPGTIEWLGAPGEVPGPWFGGLAFDARRPPSPEWAGFPVSRWVLPELLVCTRGGRTELAAFAPLEGGETAVRCRLRERLDRARAALAAPLAPAPLHPVATEPEARSDRPAWNRLTAAALEAIAEGQLEKVVLARAIELRGRAAIEPAQVLAALRTRFGACPTFQVQGGGESSFVGATPETLCRIEGRLLETEALAGSAAPDRAGELLASEKDLREHRVVLDGIREALAPLCEELQLAPAPRRMALPNVVHLRSPVRARLREGVGPAEVVAALHPTPAVGGRPREAALRFLAEHEGLDRGWYAGAVGFLGERRVDLAVALRSALLGPHGARLFVGAGVVAGSTAAGEWAETEAKSLTMRQALGGGHGG
ncbi:MAG: isochorismate synthase [Myxococcaceae bacterium]